MAGNHAILSPSGFKALMLCPAKPAMEQGRPDESNEYADEGTAAHFLASECLSNGHEASHYRSENIAVSGNYTGWADGLAVPDGCRHFTVTDEMVEAVQVYLDTVCQRMDAYRLLGAESVELYVEQSLPIGHITGEDGAEGTGDAVIIASFPGGTATIDVGDLKYGKGVEVSAEDNPQLKLYGLGALEKFGQLYEFTQVNTFISQPRISPVPSDFEYSVEHLVAWGEGEARAAAEEAWHILNGDADDRAAGCNPHEDACRFCKAKSTCPALARSVEQALGAEFTDLTTQDQVEQQQIVERLAPPGDNLGAKMDAVPLVEMWCKAIRARVEGHLLDGKPVPGYKLVAGRKGARAWSDAAEAEKLLKTFRLKKEQMYDLSLISPTTAEKVLKATPKRWAKVTPLIAQNEGKPSVAPVSDKRPALEIKPIESEFSAIGGAEDLV